MKKKISAGMTDEVEFIEFSLKQEKISLYHTEFLQVALLYCRLIGSCILSIIT